MKSALWAFVLVLVTAAAGLSVAGCHAETRPVNMCLSDPSYRAHEGASEVTVLGQVRVPGRFPYRSGLTLRAAIDTAGGMTPLASPGRVRVTRGSAARACEIDVNLDRVVAGRQPDPTLRAGDLVYVGSRHF